MVICYKMLKPIAVFCKCGALYNLLWIMSFWSNYEKLFSKYLNKLSPHLNLKSCLPVYWICIMLRYLRHYAVILTLNRYIKKWQTKKKKHPIIFFKTEKTQTITLGRLGHFFCWKWMNLSEVYIAYYSIN